ncbi:hypothetical protein LSAT2_015612, partial [Lamellibrachia satsuma]
YPRSRRRVIRRRRRPIVQRRKFKWPFYKRRCARTAPRRRRHAYIKKTIVCPVKVYPAPRSGGDPHLTKSSFWNVSDIPVEMRTIWTAMYEKVRLLKVTFKYWVTDLYPMLTYNKDVTAYMIRSWGRVPELR